jgi:D-alanine-D-alanine ligase
MQRLFPHRFHRFGQGSDLSRNQYLAGLTKASLYPKALKAQGIEFADFLHDQIALAAKRAQK